MAGQPARERHEQRRLGVEHLRQRPAVVARRPEVPELGERVGVERPGDHPAEAERSQPLDHLAGRLVGEGHDEDLLRRHVARPDGIRGATADHPGLAGAGPREDCNRAGHGFRRLALTGVQVGDERLEVRLVRSSGWHGHATEATSPDLPRNQPVMHHPSP
jgi:hypothetical protein